MCDPARTFGGIDSTPFNQIPSREGPNYTTIISYVLDHTFNSSRHWFLRCSNIEYICLKFWFQGNDSRSEKTTVRLCA